MRPCCRSTRWAGVAGLGAEGPVRIGDLVGAPVLLDLGGGLTPDPPTPGRLRHRPERLQDIAGPISLDRHPVARRCQARARTTCRYCGPRWALAPASRRGAAGAGATPAPGHGPGWPVGWPPPTHPAPSRLVAAAAQPAKHAGRLTTGGRLVGGQDLLGLLAVGGGPLELPAAVAGGLVELATAAGPARPAARPWTVAAGPGC